MSRVNEERAYWDKAAESENVMDEWICDPTISIENCADAIGSFGSGINLSIQEKPIPFILDIGCGIGRMTHEFKNRIPSAVLVGIDISSKMISLARKANLNRSSAVYFQVNDGRSCRSPSPESYFDAAFSILLFQHLDLSGVIAYTSEAFRVLKPRGIFRFQFIEGTEQEPFSRHFSLGQMLTLIHKAGFYVIKIDQKLVHEQWTWITAVKP
jgi:ubiquinone/menaquinone biosynthesis C-methylase UbiE